MCGHRDKEAAAVAPVLEVCKAIEKRQHLNSASKNEWEFDRWKE